MSFSPADNHGTTTFTPTYSTGFTTDKGFWPRDTEVTVTAPQSFFSSTPGTDGYQTFYGWFSGKTGDWFFADAGRTFTADTAYVGSNPVLVFKPDDWADDFDVVFVGARYAQRYLRSTGWDASLGSLAAELEAAHYRERFVANTYQNGDFTIAAGDHSPYDWVLSGGAIFGFLGLGYFGKIGGADPLGVYTYVGGGPGLTPVTVYAGGFDP